MAAAVLPLARLKEMADRTAAVRTGRGVGMPEVAAVRDMIHFFTEMDERHGGRHGRSALVQYLSDDVASFVRGNFRNEEARRQMLSAASRGGVHSTRTGKAVTRLQRELTPSAHAVFVARRNSTNARSTSSKDKPDGGVGCREPERMTASPFPSADC
ncbi:hypothetical protein [Streptomyces sp. NPDC058953]